MKNIIFNILLCKRHNESVMHNIPYLKKYLQIKLISVRNYLPASFIIHMKNIVVILNKLKFFLIQGWFVYHWKAYVLYIEAYELVFH